MGDVKRLSQSPAPRDAGHDITANSKQIAVITAINLNTLTVRFGVGVEQQAGVVDVYKSAYINPATSSSGTQYTYTHNADGTTRTSDDGSSTENQVLIPPYFVGAQIVVGPAPADMAAIVGGTPLDLIEVDSPRFWSTPS